MKFDINKYKKPFKFPEGSKVRISLNKGLFSREFKERFSREIFTVSRSYKKNSIELYDVKDCSGEVLKSAFYSNELTRYRDDPNIKHKIQRVFDEELRGGKSYVHVKFEDSPCKEWILKSSMTKV
jgi:predicted DNA-binding antitoxin AbrB/MazE fold protein